MASIIHNFYMLLYTILQALALYKGVLPPLLMQGVMNGIVFGVEKTTARFVRPRIHDSNVVRKEMKVGFYCGLAAGFVQSFVCAPMELVKIRTQHQGIGTHDTHYKGNWATLTEIYRKGGIRGCYQGLWVTALRETPAFAVYFSTYEGQMSFIAKKKGIPKKDVGLTYSFFCGGITGTLTWVFNYPVDVVKTRFQMDGTDSKPRAYRNARDCFVKMWREGGVRLLYRGLSPCLVRAFANSSFLFVAVELSSNVLQNTF